MGTRGFCGRRQPPEVAKRIPPGQHLIDDFPVLTAGPNPKITMQDWTFTLKVGPKPIKVWTWDAFNALPQTKITRDIHCVTTWTKFDTQWEGVSFDDILRDANVEPPTGFVLAHSYGGYSTNLPTADLVAGKAMVALKYDGQPLATDHGGPARLVVPHLYFWKSAKWISAIQFTTRDEAAFGNCAVTICTATLGSNSALPVTEATPDSASAVRWQMATVTAIHESTPRIKSVFLSLPHPFVFRAGQHVDIRLTAPDGYHAIRSYSIASAPRNESEIELAIERLDDGEVSPYVHDVLAVGDLMELRGPLGGHFVWPSSDPGPLLLAGGGSGVVPLVSMIRYRHAAGTSEPTLLLYSARRWDDVLYRDELLELDERDERFWLILALTRDRAGRTGDYSRRVDDAMISEVLTRLPGAPTGAFVCGTNSFVNAAADGAVAAGIPARAIRTERYGV